MKPHLNTPKEPEKVCLNNLPPGNPFVDSSFKNIKKVEVRLIPMKIKEDPNVICGLLDESISEVAQVEKSDKSFKKVASKTKSISKSFLLIYHTLPGYLESKSIIKKSSSKKTSKLMVQHKGKTLIGSLKKPMKRLTAAKSTPTYSLNGSFPAICLAGFFHLSASTRGFVYKPTEPFPSHTQKQVNKGCAKKNSLLIFL